MLPIAFALCLLSTLCHAETPSESESAMVVPSEAAPPSAKRIAHGREFFQKKQYAKALLEFKAALAQEPTSYEARLLCGLAAYWTHDSDAALEYWNALLDLAPRGSAKEWELQNLRVLALSALSQEAAETCVERLYELHHKTSLKVAFSAHGFVREHVFVENLRMGVWEVFDERNESEIVWNCPVIASTPAINKTMTPEDSLRKVISVQVATMPGGTAGFALMEEGLGYLRTYQRWAKKPTYATVRPIFQSILNEENKQFSEKKISNAEKFSPEPTPTPSGGSAPVSDEKAEVKKEALTAQWRSNNPSQLQAESLGLSPEATRIVAIALRLKDLDFDVTRLTRLSITDPELAERQLYEFKGRSPYAQEDAAKLVDLLSNAKAEHYQEAFAAILKIGARKAYFDFTLLTALNTRAEQTLPENLLETLQQSRDFMVRQTALLLAARRGEHTALENLFKEIASADAPNANVLFYSLTELVGLLPTPPAASSHDEATLKKWAALMAEWNLTHRESLKFDKQPAIGDPFWVEK